jgi:drug/metabolite transporter (DMT)-like permease
MTTLAFALLALSSFLLWRRQARWSWTFVMLALVLGIAIFVNDVNFSANLGIQL